jgi:hypothetical protein
MEEKKGKNVGSMRTIAVVSERDEASAARRVHQDLKRHGFDVDVVTGQSWPGVELIVHRLDIRVVSAWPFIPSGYVLRHGLKLRIRPMCSGSGSLE